MSTICDDLRAAILQAAMQGSLTDSDSESWNESKIEDVCELCTGNSISENVKKAKYMKVVEGRNYIGTKDLLFDHSFNYENGVKIPFDETSFRIANRGDILLCIEGGSAGRKIGILEEDVSYGNKLCRFSPNDRLNNKFLYFYIQSPLFQEQFSGSMTGIIGGVSIKKIKAITIKCPDIAEQKRIVEKVDELMARVTDLEQSADALASLKKAFPDDIKASLLQAAMQGKLTKQLSEDGNAEDLLEKNKAEKEKLIAEGKIKKQKPLAPITDNEIPFSIPKNWRWVRLGEVCSVFGRIGFRGYTRQDLVEEGKGAITLSPSNIKNGKMDYSKCTYVSWAKYNESPEIMVNNGDILVVKTGSSYGKSAVVEQLPLEATINPQYVVLRFIGCNNYYLQAAISSEKCQQQFEKFVIGTSIPTFSQENLNSTVIPIPPLAEQKRIVERLNTLMQNINMVEDLIASE